MSAARTAADPTPGPSPRGAWQTLVRGLRLSPELRRGLGLTLLLALVATSGRIVVPIAVQRTIDGGLLAEGGPDVAFVVRAVLAAAGVVVLASLAGGLMNARLASATETALSGLRVRTFRHVHDLSMLHQADEQRGSLVSRVTADVDTISQFMQWGGVVLLVNVGQLLLATVAMAVYSWQLTLVVVGTFLPLVLLLRWFQSRLSRAYDVVRVQVGRTLSAIAESVVGAPVIRAYGAEGRTDERVGEAVDRQYDASVHAVRIAAAMFSSGELFAAAATAGAVVVGVLLGLGGQLSAGRLIAFLFLVTLFVGPVQIATEVLDQAQTAIAGWRRILGVLDMPTDVADPALAGSDAVDIPPGPIAVRFEAVEFRYPGATAAALESVDVAIAAQRRVAVVGETGSGKTTFAKLLTRLMDPSAGRVLANGVPLDRVRFASLRRRIVMVPQDGFLFDTTVAENVRHGRPGIAEDEIALAFTELGLADWVEQLPHGLATRVGERGESLSVGERQLVALARAYVANPDLLVLDEATSAVDPATEVRLQRALEGLTRGRTAIAIAHRLSTAEAADEILVFDQGELVQRGSHVELVHAEGPYAGLHRSWARGRSPRAPAA
ncbi:MAG: ABC transporter ATP-binding protein [Euzebyaceae bacterium]|nr:ABC transporter ATP-binding protein [Euzebyaceae bacterium]